MAGEEAVCLWTDPPYGVDYEGRYEEEVDVARTIAPRA